MGATLGVGATVFLSPAIYGSKPWFILWALVGLWLLYSLTRSGMRRDKPLWFFHLSMLLIIIGGGVTSTTGKKGSVHLRPGESALFFYGDDGKRHALPCSLKLKSFEIINYEGMSFPSDFRSIVTAADGKEITISMNKIGHLRMPDRLCDDYRLYQTSYDSEGGTILTVSFDPAGIMLTYSGYFLFLISGVIMLAGRRWKKKNVTAVIALLAGFQNMGAAPAVSSSVADSLYRQTVIFRGKKMPYEIMARNLTMSLTGKEEMGGMSATRFIASLSSFPDDWETVAFIRIKDKQLARHLDAGSGYVSHADLFLPTGAYRPSFLWRGGEGELDKGILQLDEKAALLAELWEGNLFKVVSADSDEKLSSFRTTVMLLYVRLHPGRLFFISGFLLSVLSFVVILSRRYQSILFIGGIILSMFGSLVFFWHWISEGEAPLVNTPDLMFFTAVMASWVSAFLARYSKVISIAGYAITGAIALVAWIGSQSPVLTPLMPVLHSPWLSIHVSVVMTAYTLLGFASVCGLMGWTVKTMRGKMSALSFNLTITGIWMLGIGIWTGAIWANVSWGRYWGWDPKETWALVTMLIYAIPLHRVFQLRNNPRKFCIYITLAFLSIVMTYAGVNMLSSLHSYR